MYVGITRVDKNPLACVSVLFDEITSSLKMAFQKKKKTSYQDGDALLFTQHRCSTQQDANHNPLDRKPAVPVTP